jgi:hypothetical protein
MDKAYNDAGPQSQAYGSAFLLAGGMALLIPTFVVVLNATRYHPPEEGTPDRAPTNTPPADPGKVGGSVVTSDGKTTPADTKPAPAPSGGTGGTGGAPPAPPPQSLFDIHDGSFRLTIPIPEVRSAYTMREVHDLGVRQVTEVRFPVLKVAF